MSILFYDANGTVKIGRESLNSSLVSSSGNYIHPSGDTTGETDRININAALASLPPNKEVLLAPGIWYVDQQIQITPTMSGVRLRCPGNEPATFKPTYTSVLGASERTNAVFYVKPTLRTDLLSTTLGVDYFQGSSSVSVSNVSDTIDGATSYTLSGAYGWVKFISDSTNNAWLVFNDS